MVWTIAGDAVRPTEWTLTPRQLSVSFEVARTNIESWRRYERAGDFRVTRQVGGGFRAETTQTYNTDDTVIVDPDAVTRPPLAVTEWLVTSYQDAQLGPTRYEIDMSFQRQRDRVPQYAAVTESADDFTLTLSRGQLGLSDTQVLATTTRATTAGRQPTVQLRLDDGQAKTLIDTATTPAAVINRRVPDGRDFTEVQADRQAIDLVSPAESELANGRYAIQSWSLSRAGYTSHPWQVELSLALIARATVAGQFGGSQYGHVQANGTADVVFAGEYGGTGAGTSQFGGSQ